MRKLYGAAFLMLLAVPMTGMAQGEQDDDAALKLLDTVAHTYSDATSYRLEWTTEIRSTAEMQTTWSKQVFRAEEGTKSRYRFEGEGSSGMGIVVSDGSAEYDYHRTYRQYIKRLPDSYGHPFPTIQVQPQDSYLPQTAFNLRRNLGATGASLKSAHFLDEETITIDGRAVACAVVTYGPEDLRRPYANNTTYVTYWIDRTRHVLVRSLQAYDLGTTRDASGTTLHLPVRHSETITTYHRVELNGTIPDEDFAYTPPDDAQLVAEFPAPPPPGSTVRPAVASIAKPEELVGRLAPLLTLHGATDGTTLDLTSLRGHAVLVDLWATWCGPCLVEMPLIDRIQRKTKDAGLVVLGLDSDDNGKIAEDFLKRKQYGWPDYHEAQGRGFPHAGIPTMVLIDASGKMVYYHTGNTDGPGLLAAIRKLDPAFEVALKDEK